MWNLICKKKIQWGKTCHHKEVQSRLPFSANYCYCFKGGWFIFVWSWHKYRHLFPHKKEPSKTLSGRTRLFLTEILRGVHIIKKYKPFGGLSEYLNANIICVVFSWRLPSTIGGYCLLWLEPKKPQKENRRALGLYFSKISSTLAWQQPSFEADSSSKNTLQWDTEVCYSEGRRESSMVQSDLVRSWKVCKVSRG